MSRHHPKRNQPVTIKNGPLKGRIFYVVNYLESQYQGKSIDRIKADHLTTSMKNRGKPVDSDTVFGKFYPAMEYGCVHDSELKDEAPIAAPVAEPKPPEPVVEAKKPKKKQKYDA